MRSVAVMSNETRPARQDEADAYERATYHGFHVAAVDERDVVARAAQFRPGRWQGAFDAGRIVATVRTMPLSTTMVGGGELTSCGVTSVTTRSTHRRRGLMQQLLVAALRDGRERGEPLTTLIAAEWPIYGRFGYGPATEHGTVEITTSAARWLTQGEGEVEQVDLDELVAEARPAYDAHRRRSPSELERDDFVWSSYLRGLPSEPWKGFQALCRDDAGAVSGFVQYKIDTAFDGRRPAGVVTVDILIGASPAVEARLWRYVCEIDWARKVVARNRRVTELLPHWLADGRAAIQTERADFLWARPLDVAACLAGRTYAAPLDTTIEVVDPLGLSDGRWRVQADGGGSPATVTAATGPTDLTVPVATVGAVLFGSVSWWVLHATGGVDEHSTGAVAAAEAAFHSAVVPWSASWF